MWTPTWKAGVIWVRHVAHCFVSTPLLALFTQPQISCVPTLGRTLVERSFESFGPVIWNSLPLSVRHASSLSSLLHTDLSFSFFSFYQHIATNVCVCVHVCTHMTLTFHWLFMMWWITHNWSDSTKQYSQQKSFPSFDQLWSKHMQYLRFIIPGVALCWQVPVNVIYIHAQRKQTCQSDSLWHESRRAYQNLVFFPSNFW